MSETKYIEPQKVVSITLRNNTKLLEVTCEYIEKLAGNIGFDKEKTETIFLLTQNVLNRRMIYAYKGAGEITLDVFLSSDRLIIEIADKGQPYWIDVKNQLEIYERKADEYSIKKLGKEGQRFSMSFYLDSDFDISKFKKQNDAPEEKLLDGNLTLKAVSGSEKDIVEAMKCIYSNYGYDYPNVNVYTPYKMKRILREGKQLSYLGVNDHGQVLAHIALIAREEIPKMPELGALVCKPFARGNNVAARMVQKACEMGKNEDINGIIGIPVSFHPISQKLLNRQGFVPTGLFPNYVTGEASEPYIKCCKRTNAFLCVCLLNPHDSKVIYAPEEHRAFIGDKYEKLGCGCTFGEKQEPLGENIYRISCDYDFKVGLLTVDNISEDFSESIDSIMGEFIKNGMEMTKAYINMSNPSAPYVYDILKENGFFFCGILPGSENGEYLIMANPMGHDIDWNNMIAIENYDKVLEYVNQVYLEEMQK